MAVHRLWLDLRRGRRIRGRGYCAWNSVEDVDEDFICPECGVGKADFEMIEIG